MDNRRAVQVTATLVTALLAALIVIGLTSTRLGREPQTAASSAPVASRDYGPPPEGVNLIYVHDPAHANWLIGFDWTGAPRATVKLDAARSAALMAPDGHAFAVGLNAKGGVWQFLDGLGAPVAERSTLPGALLPMWADDNRHVCSTAFDPQTLAWSLWTQLPGDAPKQVAVLATDTVPGETNLRVVACSFKNDVAIAERITQAWPSEYWLVTLSDGSVQVDQKRTGSDMSMFTASADAQLLAENSSRSAGEVDAGAPSTVIVRARDGQVVANLDPSMGVLAFNADGSAALVTLRPWVGGQPIHLGVVALPSAALVWQDEGTTPYFFGQFLAQPGGKWFAIAYPTTGDYPSPSNIALVSPEGAVTKLDRLYAPAW